MQFWLAAKGCFLKVSWVLWRNLKTWDSAESLLVAVRSDVRYVCSAQCRESNLLISSFVGRSWRR